MEEGGKKLLRNFLLELLLYGFLVVVYFLVALRFLGDPLTVLYRSNPVLYAAAAIVLIVAQGVVLEWITSFLVKLLGLERL